jgi:SAM-dependent methyltransferase
MTEKKPTETESLDQSLAEIRHAVERQLGVERPPAADVDPATVTRFSPNLPEQLDPDRRQELEAIARQLDPWLQGPFLLGGDLVVGGAWRIDARWNALEGKVPADLSGKRVLDVGTNAGYDAFMFRLRGAGHVLAIEPSEFLNQALFLESIYESGADFQYIGWQELDPERHGSFDLVHCNGVLYHELDPIRMLVRLRRMVGEDGVAYIGSMMLASPELSEFARFVPTSYYGDPTWWWVPGRLALRWMLETAGFDVVDEIDLGNGPPGEFEVVNGYLVAKPAGEPPVDVDR